MAPAFNFSSNGGKHAVSTKFRKSNDTWKSSFGLASYESFAQYILVSLGHNCKIELFTVRTWAILTLFISKF